MAKPKVEENEHHRPIFTMSSVDDEEEDTSDTTSDTSEEEEEEDDEDDDDTLVLGQSTLTLTTLDGAAGTNLEDSVEGRLAKVCVVCVQAVVPDIFLLSSS